MTEAIETIEFDDTPEAEEVVKPEVTVLEAWASVLSHVESESKIPVRMAMVIPVLSNYPWLTVKEMPNHFASFYGILQDAYQALMFEIATDENCLKRGETDAEDNHNLYVNIIISWSKILREFEDNWDARKPWGGTQLSAGIAATEYLIGEQGLLSHLGSIGFRYHDGDFEMVAAAVEGGEVS